jgi:phosphoribosylglycinamide formyltransferase-1
MIAGSTPLRLAVLVSGRGSNLAAIAARCADGSLPATIVQVLSDRDDAGALPWCASQGIPARAIAAAGFRSAGHFDKDAFETALMQAIDDSGPQLVVLAGFMRVLSARFTAHYAGRLLNIHPSLLPQHKGLHTHERALAAGDREHGASVHYVTAELDGGPVVLQARVPVLAGDTADTLAARVLAQEHQIYSQVIGWIASGRLRWQHDAPWFDGAVLTAPLQGGEVA